MTPHEAQRYLDSFINHELHLGQVHRSDFKLERAQKMLHGLGSPQNNLNIIHVAGSKGKGSICAMTASILKEAGYKVGLYTSPHFNHYRERIRILSKGQSNLKPTPGVGLGLDVFFDMITEEELCVVLDEIKQVIEQAREESEHLSFFEVYTVAALYYFSRQKVDFVVLETGLGGRLDATNAVDSLVAVLAPISLEHTQILGDSMIQIAQEKAAIIKNAKQKVVIARQDEAARDVFEHRCREYGIAALWVEDNVDCHRISQSFDEQVFDMTTSKRQYKQIRLPLLGGHQRDNAAVAVSISESLQDIGFTVGEQAICDGLCRVVWPGRFEIIRKEPLIILDGAHNKASVQALRELINEFAFRKKITLVLGVSQDKDIKSLCGEFNKITKHIIYVQSKHPRAHKFPKGISVEQGIERACQQSEPDDIVLVSGSLFVVGEARAALMNDGLAVSKDT